MEEVRCRLKREEGKLVEIRLVYDEERCRVVHAVLEGEFFADPGIEEEVARLPGLDVREALERLRKAIHHYFVAPAEDVSECIDSVAESIRCR